MTLEEMRVLLSMPSPDFTDEQVIAAYADSLGGGAEPSPLALVTLEQAKQRLRLLDSDHDQEVEELAIAASHIVCDYLQRPDHGWTAETAPPAIQIAVLIVLDVLFSDDEGTDPINQAVQSILIPYRRMVLA